ncbi:MarR family winged helix-turn-helix transcriptional regulator [Hoeflea sp. TYP-13]|uniref:MarR family winged helix-turn-helix transcriptional regulator n=1 Tax=Hoeflea sp. TYP-13 TaxID=3230023 RepID=UPI0034C6176B
MKQPSSGADSTVFRFFLEISAIAQASDKLIDRALPHELKRAHFLVLDHLARDEANPTLLELARAMQVTKGAITNTMQRLEARGFVTVVPDEYDGRSKRAKLTGLGQIVRDDALRAVAPDILELAKTISAPDMIEALPLLERIRKYLDVDIK